MKLPCNVVQDLLPLYHDGVCSEESKNLVQEHIATCAQCKDFLHDLKEDAAPDKVDAAKPLLSIQMSWNKQKRNALLKGLMISLLICATLFASFVLATQWYFIEISTHEMEVAEIYQLKDGRIIYKLDVPEGVYCQRWKFVYTEDGGHYKIPVTTLINAEQLQGFESYLDDYLMIDPDETNAYMKHTGGPVITSWYMGNPETGITLLIYEEGMVLEPAPAELEARYGIG